MQEHLAVLAEGRDAGGSAWFARVARRLLEETDLLVDGRPHRLKELELYYHGGDHPDPFAHRDPLQLTCGRWYFHRGRGTYRGGSFKGLDVSFGPAGVFGGVLIRTLEAPGGREINGCSLCVDHLVALTGAQDVAALDAALGERPVWDESGLLALRPAAEPRAGELLATARVGLTLKTMARSPELPRYIMRRYRFLTDPTIKKGKVHTVIALHQSGKSTQELQALTASPARVIEGYLAAYEAGRSLDGFASYRGLALGIGDLCRLHGTWAAHFAEEER